MKATIRLSRYVVYDLLRSRVVLAYTLFLLAVSLALFNLEDSSTKGILSLMNIVLMVVPLVSIIFSTIHLYNAQEFMVLLLTQPIRRNTVLASQYIGVAVALSTAVSLGVGIPTLLYGGGSTGFLLYLISLVLTFVFTSLAFLAAMATRDKARGIGLAILLWFFFTLVYDGLVLFLLFAFSDFPLEKPMLVLTALNPVDLARISLLLNLDLSAMMGFTGALYQKFLGSAWGFVVSLSAQLLWITLPLAWAFRIFKRKDL
jgi:Cu-processing system permease protein